MSKRFIVATDPLTAEQEQAFRIKLGPMGFWHWLPNFWLIKTSEDYLTAGNFRDWIHEIAPYARVFATEVESGTKWSGMFKPDAQGRNMADWIHSDWETP